MRVLLDECVAKDLARYLPGHTVSTVSGSDLAGLKNGALLAKAAERVDVVVTVDRNLVYQNNLRNLPVALIILRAQSNRLPDLMPLTPDLPKLLDVIQPREVLFLPRP